MVKFPRISVEVLADKNVPKNKTDDKQLRQAQIGPVTNDPSPALLETIDDNGELSVYRIDGSPLTFLQLNP